MKHSRRIQALFRPRTDLNGRRFDSIGDADLPGGGRIFSGSEIGIVSADRVKLRHAAAKGSRGAKLALQMLEKPEWLLSTTLVGTNIAVVTKTTMATALKIDLFGPGSSWLAVVIAAPFIGVYGEIGPKSVFQQRADVITPRAIYI